jgi:parallel beta-helix repeat protein
MRRVRRQDRLAPTRPSALAVMQRTQTSVRLKWRAARDNRAVARYRLYRDGARVGSVTATTALFSGLACGRAHRLGVDAVDRSGHRSARAEIAAATESCAGGNPPTPPPPPGPPPPPPAPPPGLGTALPAPLPASSGTTFYVATTGADTNPGTLAQPWKTVQKAESTLQPGQRALVRAGTYTQELYWDRDGTAANPITLEAYPGEKPVLRTSGGYVLEIVASYVRIRGFKLENATNTNIYLENPSDHVEISGNEITGSDDQGIYVEGNTASHQILANWIHHNGLCGCAGHQSHGIYLEGSNHLVASNVIHDMPTGFGIQVYPTNTGSIVVGNTAVNNGYAGIVLGGSGGVKNVVVRNNVFAFNAQQGIAHDSACATSSVADHNVLFGNGSGAIESGCAGVDRSGGNRTTDPLFVDFAARDMHLKAGAPAIDYGLLTFSPIVDFEGRVRSYGAGPDAGAYEFPS